MDITLPCAKTTIAVIGNINLDIKTTAIPATDALFRDGETTVGEIYETFGGGATNVAVAARSLGADVYFCGAVGSDALGDRLSDALAGLGIHPRLARKQSASGRSINLNWDNHHRHFLSSLPAAADLEFQDIDVHALSDAGCRHLYRGDAWFSSGMLAQGNLEIMQLARSLGMVTYLDINWDPLWSLPGEWDQSAHRITLASAMLPYVSFVHVNERELSIFTSREDLQDAVDALLDQGVQTVILHRGPGGSAAVTQGMNWIEAPAVPVSHIACETGTGDVFSAAFMILESLPLHDRLVASNQVAARYLQGEVELIPRL